MNDHYPPESKGAGLREIFVMAGPIILSTLSHTVMQFADQFMVARLSAEAMAAVGSARIWSFTLTTFFLGVIGCVSTFVGQCFGRSEYENCARYAWQGIYIAIGTGVIVLGLWFLSGPIFNSMGHSPEVTALELGYFRIMLFGFCFISWQAALVSFFQGINRPRIPMVIAITSTLVNLVLNYGLIFGRLGMPRMEVNGAALATVLSLMLQVVMLQGVFLSHRFHDRYNTRRTLAVDGRRIRELVRIGWPNGCMFFIDVFNWSIFTSYLVGQFGTTALASHVAAMTFMHISFMPAVGLNHAIAPIVGQWIGRGRLDIAKARTFTALKLAIVYMSVMGLTMAAFGDKLIWFCFSKEPAIVSTGHLILVLAAVFQAFDATNIVLMGALRGAGDTRWMAVATFVVAYFFFLPLAWFLAVSAELEVIGAWLGATGYIILLALLLVWRFRSGAWRRICIFEGALTPGVAVE